MAEHVKWRGFKELEQNLDMLSGEMKDKGVRIMMSKAAEPIRDDAKRRAPVLQEPHPHRRPGTVRDRIMIWRKKKTPYAATYFVGVLGLGRAAMRRWKSENKGKFSNGGDNPNDPWYWRFLEFGTVKMAARPFLRPAFEARKMDAVKVALAEGRKFVADVATRFKKKPT